MGEFGMTVFASGGQVMCGAEGQVHVRIWGELHYVCPEDLGRLLFVGDRVSLLKKGPGEVPRESVQVSGSVHLSPSGRAVIIATGSQRYMLPRDRFVAVALGEEISCIFFEVPSDDNKESSGIVLSPLTAGGVAP
jgi:hypothetical protein